MVASEALTLRVITPDEIVLDVPASSVRIPGVDGSIGITVAAHNSLCTNAIFEAGNQDQKERYLPKLCSAEWIGSWSLTEPTAGSDAGGTQTLAQRNGDAYVLNGSKTFASQGSVCDVAVVYATLDRSLGKKGITAFIIEKGIG